MKTFIEWFTPTHRWSIKIAFFALTLLIGYIIIGKLLHSGALFWMGTGIWTSYWINLAYKSLRHMPVDKLPLIEIDPIAYAKRLKEAYTFKFGSPDLNFEKDIDRHIQANTSLITGISKEMNTAWLKSMAGFVEVPWI